MRKRIGTKTYDTEKATLIDTLPDGIQVYRKKNSPQFFVYNPNGKTGPEMFFDLPADQAVSYLTENTKSKRASNNSNTIRFRPYDLERIRILALKHGMSMNNFVMMLVDEYEKNNPA